MAKKSIEIPRSGILISEKAYAIIAVGKKDMINIQCKAKSLRAGTLRDFFLCFYGARTEASCCYLSPSNHLMMQWQATPAATATKNEISTSNTDNPPFCCQIEGSNIITIAHVRIKQNIQKIKVWYKLMCGAIFWSFCQFFMFLFQPFFILFFRQAIVGNQPMESILSIAKSRNKKPQCCNTGVFLCTSTMDAFFFCLLALQHMQKSNSICFLEWL